MSDVNQKLLSALKELLIDMTLAQNNMRQAALYDAKWEGCAEAIQPRVDAARKAVEEAEKEQERKTLATSTMYELVGKYGLEAVWDAVQTVKRGRWTD